MSLGQAEEPAPWPKGVFGVLVEVEASHAEHDGFTEASASESSVATVAFSLDAQLTRQLQAHFSTLYEEGATPSEVDEAYITLGNPETSPWQLTLGQLYLPFGAFDTALIADPYTLELGEARETALVLRWQQDGWAATGYFSRGDLTDTDGAARSNGGLSFSYQQGDDQQGWQWGISYLHNLADSDGITGALEANAAPLTTRIAGMGFNAAWRQAPWHLLGEYVGATEAFDPAALGYREGGAQPSTWRLELDYETGFNDLMLAVAYQQTEEALSLGLPESRWAAGLSLPLYDLLTLKVELAQDEDYGPEVGGTGQDNLTLTAQLALEY